MHIIEPITPNNGINYFSNDVNSFILEYSNVTDLGRILSISSILLNHYNELTQFLFLHLNMIYNNKIYVDELYKIAYDYYQKLFYLIFVKDKTKINLPQDTELTQLQNTLRSNLINDVSIIRIRKYLQNNVNLNETRSFLEVNQVHTRDIDLFTNLNNTLIIEYGPFNCSELKYANSNNCIAIYPRVGSEFATFNIENLAQNCSSVKESLLLNELPKFSEIIVCIPSQDFNQLLPLFVILVMHFISTGVPIPSIRACQVNIQDLVKPNGGSKKVSKLNPFKNFNNDIIVGLENEYNSCYMNCIIQCLLEVNELSSILISNSFLNDVDYSNPKNSKGMIITALANLEQTMLNTSINNKLSNQSKFCSCLQLKKCCGTMNPMFNSNREEDCLEFCEFLINCLHDDLKKGTPMGASFDKLNNIHNQKSFQEQAFSSWSSYLEKESNLMVELFQGQMASVLQCQYCLCQSNTFQIFSSLSLSLPAHPSCYIHESMNQFYRSENLIGINEWECSNCKTKRPATQRLQITKFPKILIIQLNRFSNYMNKNTCYVKYPHILDLTAYSNTESIIPKYSLFGVTCHTGTMDVGHYSSYVKKQDDTWWYFDDTKSRPVHFANEFISPDAYILFYKMIN
ncbi:similar to Saccharomyces cerevisiae YER144C UBP5 Putative ubiquitin-specific protease, closest paralog of Doa4p but has no functional overlap [Maudiozyma saulgeensis]|uniref:Ubiquitin carboxyl-terminal hydrolase n=1 Tax=Maudiozyma saulgeensis TaxID=1789683 RepID=A0A1X7R8X8_9SACH|nr:similar to Saccharomyces cerevisiae YER144C UBP5 Putative ubiquitin-specific protease, closest paralog of Doa4p but has no functional overlap [Kazachstania saulgeensis]